MSVGRSVVEVARHDTAIGRRLVSAAWGHLPIGGDTYVERVPDQWLPEAIERRPVARCSDHRREIPAAKLSLGVASQRHSHEAVEAAWGVISMEWRVRAGQGMGQVFQAPRVDQEPCLIRQRVDCRVLTEHGGEASGPRSSRSTNEEGPWRGHPARTPIAPRHRWISDVRPLAVA